MIKNSCTSARKAIESVFFFINLKKSILIGLIYDHNSRASRIRDAGVNSSEQSQYTSFRANHDVDSRLVRSMNKYSIILVTKLGWGEKYLWNFGISVLGFYYEISFLFSSSFEMLVKTIKFFVVGVGDICPEIKVGTNNNFVNYPLVAPFTLATFGRQSL